MRALSCLARHFRIFPALVLACFLSIAAHAAAPNAIRQIDMGKEHSCAVTMGGALYCWGGNTYGQVGTGEAGAAVEVPARIFAHGVASVSTGEDYTCAVVDGALYCWGRNELGQLALGTVSKSEPSPTLAISKDVRSVAVAHGNIDRTCAVVKDALQCWGYNSDDGELGPPDGNQTPAARHHTIIESGVSGVGVGFDDICAIVHGSLQCWGGINEGKVRNNGHKVTVPVELIHDGVTNVSVGVHHICAVANGTLLCWGEYRTGGIGDGRDLSANWQTSFIREPVEVIHEGVSSVLLDSDSNAYNQHTCAIAHGALRCWGSNGGGKIDPATRDKTVLTQFQMLASGVSSMAESPTGNRCVIVDGALRCRGDRSKHQLLTWPHAMTETLPWNDPTGDIATLDDNTMATLASAEQSAARRLAPSVEQALQGKLVSDGATIFSAQDVHARENDGQVKISFNPIPLYTLRKPDNIGYGEQSYQASSIDASAKCGDVMPRTSSFVDGAWTGDTSGYPVYVARDDAFQALPGYFRGADPLAPLVLGLAAPWERHRIVVGEADLKKAAECAGTVMELVRSRPFQSMAVRGSADDKPWSEAVTPRANALWQVDSFHTVNGFTIVPKPDLQISDFSMQAQSLTRMVCGGYALKHWKEAGAATWNMTRKGMEFTLDEAYTDEMNRESAPLPAYASDELPGAIAGELGPIAEWAKVDPAKCLPAVWGNKYTVQYRSKTVQTIYVERAPSPLYPDQVQDQNRLALHIANALELPRAPEYASAKALPGDPSRAIFVYAERNTVDGKPAAPGATGDYGEATFDLHLLVVKAGSAEILARYDQDNALSSDAIHLDGIGIDTAAYTLANGVRAFGVRTGYGHHGCASYGEDVLSLYLLQGHEIKRVLRDLKLAESNGMCGSCGDYSHSQSTLSIGRSAGKGLADLVVKTESVHADPGTMKGDECIAPEQHGKSKSVLHFDGEKYVIPQELQALSP
jgi:hypothetical protein